MSKQEEAMRLLLEELEKKPDEPITKATLARALRVVEARLADDERMLRRVYGRVMPMG